MSVNVVIVCWPNSERNTIDSFTKWQLAWGRCDVEWLSGTRSNSLDPAKFIENDREPILFPHLETTRKCLRVKWSKGFDTNGLLAKLPADFEGNAISWYFILFMMVSISNLNAQTMKQGIVRCGK